MYKLVKRVECGHMKLRTDLNYENKSLEDFMNSKVDRKNDLICFSHLRWDFVYQRPQHLLTRAAQDRRVYYVEEPQFDNSSMRLEICERDSGVKVVVPVLPNGLSSQIAMEAVLQQMVDRLLVDESVHDYVSWYYTPMALDFTRHLKPAAIVYDCMDELSAFKNAPKDMTRLERELFQVADLVFTGGQTLYEAKRKMHESVYAFPSSIDREHFQKARVLDPSNEPEDQEAISRPRLGFFGVIDERFDIDLLREVATARADWNFVIIGPVVKIDPEVLPRLPNIHYLGGKTYADLPAYIAGWDVALLLFARNESTRFISPTKTPEYLAAGKPVVSTSIRDVVRPYGENQLVEIADAKDDFIRACERCLAKDHGWLASVDAFLADNSWDSTWDGMSQLIDQVLATRRKPFMRSQKESLNQKALAHKQVVA